MEEGSFGGLSWGDRHMVDGLRKSVMDKEEFFFFVFDFSYSFIEI